MEIILKQDVQKLGFKEDIVNVKPGYGRNYLIPQGLAILATPSAKKVLAENLRQRAHKEAKLIADAQVIGEALKALDIKISVKTGGGEKLFGSVTNQDLADVFAKEGQAIDKKYITSGLIKNLGRYTASVRLHRDVIVDVEYEVVAE